MSFRNGVLVATLLATGVVCVGGCPLFDPRLTNQGGGSLLSAVFKAADGNLTAVTPDEIQIVTDFAIDQSDAPITPLDDQTAQTIADIIEQNGLNSIAAIEALLADPSGFDITDEQLEVLAAFVAGQAAAEQAEQ